MKQGFTTPIGGSFRIAYSFGNFSGPGNYIYIGSNDGTSDLIVEIHNGSSFIDTTAYVPTPGVWFYWAARYDGFSSVDLIINGTIISTASVNIMSMTFDHHDENVGSSWADFSFSYMGTWSHALTLTELVTQSQSFTNVIEDIEAYTQLITPMSILDTSGHGHNWVLTGGLNFDACPIGPTNATLTTGAVISLLNRFPSDPSFQWVAYDPTTIALIAGTVQTTAADNIHAPDDQNDLAISADNQNFFHNDETSLYKTDKIFQRISTRSLDIDSQEGRKLAIDGNNNLYVAIGRTSAFIPINSALLTYSSDLTFIASNTSPFMFTEGGRLASNISTIEVNTEGTILYYTLQLAEPPLGFPAYNGFKVYRWDLINNVALTSLITFADLDNVFRIRRIPNSTDLLIKVGHGDGATGTIYRVNTGGNIVTTYALTGDERFGSGLAIVPDTLSFWNSGGGVLSHYQMSNGALLARFIDNFNGFTGIGGALIAFGVPPIPPTPPLTGCIIGASMNPLAGDTVTGCIVSL